MRKRKKKSDLDEALEDPTFYIPIIGPVLHAIRRLVEDDDEDGCDGDCENCEHYNEEIDGCMK